MIRTLSAGDYLRCGVALRDKHRLPAAIACFERAVELLPEDAVTSYFLGNALLLDKRLIAAEAELRRTISLDEKFHGALHDLGMVRLERGDLAGALQLFDQAIALAPERHESRLDRALTLLMMGDWKRGLDAYEARRPFLPRLYPDDGVPEWRGGPVGRLRVVAEQGQGDTIQFSRFLWTTSPFAEELIFVVPPDLMCLFEGHPCVNRLISKSENLPPADATVALCSLANLAGVTVDACPQDPGWFIERAKTRSVEVPTCDWRPMKIGLCWAGNPGHGHDRERTIALDYFLPLMGTRRRQFYSFQVGHRAGDIALAGADPLLYDLSPQLTDWQATAAALLQMDLVISVDTAVAHLAAAIRVPTWLLIGHTPDWRWLAHGETTPWYPSMRLFRQPVAGDWGLAMMLVGEALDRLSI